MLNRSEILNNVNLFKQASNDLYIESLMYPEKVGAKIPCPLPVSSATASIRYNFSITPNSNGKFCLVIDPFYCKGYLYQDSTVDGQGNGTATEIDLSQDTNIVDQYRLVSSSVVVRYYGNFNQMSGMFIAATTSNVSNANYTDFLKFQNVEDLTNKYISKCIDGLKMIYSPMDNKATEFRPNSEYSDGTHPCRFQYLFVIIGDLFPNNTCIRVDFYRNLEYTTKPQYREYITQTKALPCNFEIPDIGNTVGNAPSPSQLYNNSNNVPWQLKVLNNMASKGNYLNPLSITG